MTVDDGGSDDCDGSEGSGHDADDDDHDADAY